MTKKTPAMTPDQLRAQRKRLGLSQPAVAADLDMGERTYQQRESGEMPVDRQLWRAMRDLERETRAKKKAQKSR